MGALLACAYTDPYYYIENKAARMFNGSFFLAIESAALVICVIALVKVLRQGVTSLRKKLPLVIGDDCSMKMKRDPLKEQRKLLAPFVKYYLK